MNNIPAHRRRRIRRTAHTGYEFDAHDGHGVLTQTGTRIAVDSRRTLGYEFALTIEHENFLLCRIFDEPNANTIYHSYDHPLSSYFLSNPHLVKVETFYTRDIPHVAYDYLSDTYRLIIRGMIAFVGHIHAAGWSMNGFNINYLVMKNNVLKFWGVEFWPADDPGREADYASIADVITELHQGETTLPLLDDLVMTLQTQSLAYKHFIDRHLVILTSSERLAFIRAASEKQPLPSSAMYNFYLSAIQNMGRNGNWNKKFIVKYPKQHGPLYVTYAKGNYNGSNRSILSFSRNSAAHLYENARKDFLIVMSEREIELTIMSEFSTQLLLFQKELSLMGHDDFQHFC